MRVHASLAESEEVNQEKFVFFLEEIPRYLHLPYFAFYLSITVIMEVLRIVVSYVTIVTTMGLSTDYLVTLWRSNWLYFMWPICMILMYYSMKHLRNHTLHTITQIHRRLKMSPTWSLTLVFRSRLQHLLPVCFLAICTSVFVRGWLDNSNIMFYSTTGPILTVPTREIALEFIQSAFLVTYNWIIGGYFSWVCLGTVLVAFDASRHIDVDRIETLHHDRCGGLSAAGSLAMAAAMLYILSVSFMFPAWIVSMSHAPDPIGLGLQIGALSSLAVMELAIFLLPMFFFHPIMKKAKDQQLTILDGRMMSLCDSLVKNSASDANSRQFRNVITAREMVRSMYEYPFNHDMLVKVVTSTSIPYLAAVISNAIQRGLRIGT
jgi:hypothetical protein